MYVVAVPITSDLAFLRTASRMGDETVVVNCLEDLERERPDVYAPLGNDPEGVAFVRSYGGLVLSLAPSFMQSVLVHA